MPYERIVKLHGNIIIGTKQTIKAMKNNEIKELFVAQDAAEHLKDKVVHAANKHGVTYTFVDSKAKLGKASNIDVDAAVVALKHTT